MASTSRANRGATVACVVAALVLTGCTRSAGSASGAASPTAAGSPLATSAATETGSDAPTTPPSTSTETPQRDPGEGVTPGGGGTAGTSEIGQAPVTYPSGIRVSVPSAVQYIPSEVAVGTVSGHTGVVLTVRVTNGSTEPLDTKYLTVGLRTGATLTPSAQIFDAANDYGSGLTGRIAAGKQKSAKYAFDLPASDLTTLNVIVTPDLRSPRSAVFTGAASAATEAP